MPTILRLKGFRFEIIPGDHEPAHTHAYHGGGRLVIYLDPIELREQVGLKPREVAAALRLAAEHRTELLDAWRALNGKR